MMNSNLQNTLEFNEIKLTEDKRSWILNVMHKESSQDFSYSSVKEIVIECKNGTHTVGIIVGYLFYGSCLIDILWVQKSFRDQGVGGKLLEILENIATKNNARFSTVTTMSFWNASYFYAQKGYVEEFRRQGYENGAEQISLRKDL